MSAIEPQLVPWRGGFMVDPRNVPLARPGVYRIWHLDSGRCYVGAALNIKARLYSHTDCKASTAQLQEDVQAHGQGAFVVEPLFDVTSRECNLAQIEADTIAEFDAITRGYNSRQPAIGHWQPERYAAYGKLLPPKAPEQSPEPEQYLTDAQLAERLNVTVNTVRSWRFRKTGPAYVKMNRIVRYPASAVDEFLAERVRAA
jgi:hypothetical protein